MAATKVCPDCLGEQPLAQFSNRHKLCNICRNERKNRHGDGDWRKFFNQRLIDARQRHPDVSITPEYLIEMLVEQGGVCAMSGRKLTRLRGEMTKASIDRKDHTLGYIHGNVRLVTWAVNRMRNTMPDDEFRDWIMALANNPGLSDTVS